jgi:hypothetical protein
MAGRRATDKSEPYAHPGSTPETQGCQQGMVSEGWGDDGASAVGVRADWERPLPRAQAMFEPTGEGRSGLSMA